MAVPDGVDRGWVTRQLHEETVGYRGCDGTNTDEEQGPKFHVDLYGESTFCLNHCTGNCEVFETTPFCVITTD